MEADALWTWPTHLAVLPLLVQSSHKHAPGQEMVEADMSDTKVFVLGWTVSRRGPSPRNFFVVLYMAYNCRAQ